MIKQTIDINGYWKIIVYYNVNYNLFYIIKRELRYVGTPVERVHSIYNNMLKERAKAVTVSSINNNTSIVLFNKHKRMDDYISSIVHEAEHIKESMLYKYNVNNYGEPPAYTIGYIVKCMFNVFINYVSTE